MIRSAPLQLILDLEASSYDISVKLNNECCRAFIEGTLVWECAKGRHTLAQPIDMIVEVTERSSELIMGPAERFIQGTQTKIDPQTLLAGVIAQEMKRGRFEMRHYPDECPK